VDDLALVKAVTGGDGDAFRHIVERESGHVFRTCHRILGRVDEADDVTQETFMVAYRSLDTFRGQGPLGAWLARIATRQAFRRVTQRKVLVSLDPVRHDRMDPRPGPLGSVIAAERQAAIRGAVAALGEPYREVVALRFFGELSLAEIAEATERPVATVKTHLRRGLERLRQQLGEEAAA
jgi:RNA polymerase sigma-70 factor, ECF subfamily